MARSIADTTGSPARLIGRIFLELKIQDHRPELTWPLGFQPGHDSAEMEVRYE